MSFVDPEEVSLEEGKFLVRLAREAITEFLRSGKPTQPPPNTPETLMVNGAAFVTLTNLSEGREELRGCIGYTKPFEPLALNVIHAAIAAATEDPRFPPVKEWELDSIIIEVSVLSPPEELPGVGEELLNHFQIGRDGLIVSEGFLTGLLLPEVPIEYCWDKTTFISETCVKAGLEPTCWLRSSVKVYRFRTSGFKEKSPGGDVERRDLRKEYRERCGKSYSITEEF
ncbi:MAG: TIGR00296 family protein [Desulfurococcales archaeon]|nr:TIGR00296 family protein [Desulfurococcales archaeon]